MPPPLILALSRASAEPTEDSGARGLLFIHCALNQRHGCDADDFMEAPLSEDDDDLAGKK
jgi:hypothetical protein